MNSGFWEHSLLKWSSPVKGKEYRQKGREEEKREKITEMAKKCLKILILK